MSIFSTRNDCDKRDAQLPIRECNVMYLMSLVEIMMRTSSHTDSIKRGVSRGYPELMLHGHGLSRNLDGLHPLPEKPEEPGPPSIQSNFNDRLSLSSEFSTGLSSGTPSSRTGRYSNEFFNESISSAETGENTVTGRSSTYSWGNDDEFDWKASAEVRSMFAQIDCCLFENTKHADTEIKDECSDWVQSFPYLRVLGKQVLASEETGTEIIARSDSKSNNTLLNNNSNILEDIDDDNSNENPSLSVMGQKVEAKVAPISPSSKDGNNNDTLYHLKEEVFAIDGEIEEFIAYDKNSVDHRDKRKNPGHIRKKYGGIPPVTPDAFVHETSINECFDQVWIEVIHVLKGLLKLYINVRAKKEMARQHALLYSNMDGLLDSIIELPQSRDDFSRVNRLPSQLRLKDNSSMFLPHSNLNGLKELMTIRSVSLQHRAPSVNMNMTREDFQPPKESNSRPASSVLGTYRQFPKPSTFRTAEQQFYDRMLSAKIPKRNSRLQPLQTPKTAGHVETVGEVRGTRLQKNDRASPIGVVSLTQQLWGARNGMLPPLERLNTGDSALFLKDKRSSPKRHSRASSALSNESKTFVVRERLKTYPTLPASRPSTSHSYRDLAVNKSITTQQGKLKENLHSSLSKPIFHQTINEKSHFYQFPPSFKPYGEEPQDFDDFILWGHGPPLISPQRRKGKTVGNNTR